MQRCGGAQVPLVQTRPAAHWLLVMQLFVVLVVVPHTPFRQTSPIGHWLSSMHMTPVEPHMPFVQT
jgi:hypothetical protein